MIERPAEPIDLRDAGPVDFKPMLKVTITPPERQLKIDKSHQERDKMAPTEAKSPADDRAFKRQAKSQAPSRGNGASAAMVDGPQVKTHKMDPWTEAEVFRLMDEGLTVRQIATKMGLGVQDVQRVRWRRQYYRRQGLAEPAAEPPIDLAALMSSITAEIEAASKVNKAIQDAYGHAPEVTAAVAHRFLRRIREIVERGSAGEHSADHGSCG